MMQEDNVVRRKFDQHAKQQSEAALFEGSSGISSEQLIREIFFVMHFVYGTLTEHERSFYAVLEDLYMSKTMEINFIDIHRVDTIRDVLYRFPGM